MQGLTAKKVAVLGTVPNSRRIAPYDDPSWEIWCCSAGNSQSAAPPRITRWFELHSLVDMRGQENDPWRPAYYEWLNKNADKFPVYMHEKNDDVPAAIPFPYRTLIKQFGPDKTRTNWFTSSITWMMGYALHLGAEVIGVYGVDMAAAEEHYTGQKAGILRFCEIAKEMGRKVIMPMESTLAFGYPLYGYAEATNMGRALLVRENELLRNIQATDTQLRQLIEQRAHFAGAYEQVKFDRRTYVSQHLDDIEVDSGEALVARKPEMSQALPLSPPADAPVTITIPAATRVPTAADFPDNPDAVALLKKQNGSAALHEVDPGQMCDPMEVEDEDRSLRE